MAYTINRYDNTAIAIIEDGTVNTSLEVKLIGKNYAGYGEIQNENTVHMLENFAGATAPAKAIRGQLWYDTANKKLKYHTGDSIGGVKLWKTTGGTEYGAEPSNPVEGDLWFDTARDQLKIRKTSGWLAIGPQSAGTGTTQMVSRQVLDTDDNQHSIIAATINDSVVYIISTDGDFTLSTTDTDSIITGFSLIKKGLTLRNTDPITGVSGVAESVFYWGTAGNSLRLGGFAASDYVRSGIASFSTTVRFADTGYTVGDSNDLAVFIETGTEPVIQNVTGPRITFRVRDGSDIKDTLVIDAGALLPDVTETYNIGSSTKKWSGVYATNFFGRADRADQLLVGADYRIASTSAGVNTIAVRDSSGGLTATAFNGNATSATRLANLRTINGVNFDGTTNIIVEDSTKLPLTGGTLTGFLNLHSDPTSGGHAATKNYVDAKFGIGGVLSIANGGTSATTASGARSNLDVPSTSGTGATGTWNINISGTASTASNSSALNGVTASTAAAANTIAQRDSSANLTANVFNGTATSARYADLAEKYLTDNVYETGTVMMVGGDKEMTACHFGARAIGAISANPAYMMNSALEGGQYVALKGRVPVKVVGRVNKGDRMIASDGGCAIAGQHHTAADTFAIALESNDNTDVKLVECLIL